MSSGTDTTAVRHNIDIGSLCQWMSEQESFLTILAHLGMSPSSLSPTTLTVRQFGFGQSNPTYLLMLKTPVSDLADVKITKLVLRKKPNRVAHKSAHALHREFRVLESIHRYNDTLLKNNHDEKITDSKSSIPVPQIFAYCKNSDVIGAEFYIMEYIQGRIFVDPG